MWYRLLMSFYPNGRDPAAPMFLSLDRIRPYIYSAALADVKMLVGKLQVRIPTLVFIRLASVVTMPLSAPMVRSSLLLTACGALVRIAGISGGPMWRWQASWQR